MNKIIFLFLIAFACAAQAGDSKSPSPIHTAHAAAAVKNITPLNLDTPEEEEIPFVGCKIRAASGLCQECEFGLEINQDTGTHIITLAFSK